MESDREEDTIVQNRRAAIPKKSIETTKIKI